MHRALRSASLSSGKSVAKPSLGHSRARTVCPPLRKGSSSRWRFPQPPAGCGASCFRLPYWLWPGSCKQQAALLPEVRLPGAPLQAAPPAPPQAAPSRSRRAIRSPATRPSTASERAAGTQACSRGGPALSGGISGKQLVLKEFDDKCDATEGAQVGNQIVSDKSVQVVVGQVCSGATNAEDAGNPAMPGPRTSRLPPSNPSLTQNGWKNFSRIIPNDTVQSILLDQAAKGLGYKNIAIVYSNDDYGQQIDQALKENASKYGVTFVDEESYTPKQTSDFTPILTNLACQAPGGDHPRWLLRRDGHLGLAVPTGLVWTYEEPVPRRFAGAAGRVLEPR